MIVEYRVSASAAMQPVLRIGRFAIHGLSRCLCVAVVLLAGCRTQRVTTSDGWPLPPPPRQAPVPPSGTTADRMVFTVGMRPDDSNNNGFPDTVIATVQLFSLQHPTAIRQNGAFVFSLYPQGRAGTPDTEPIKSWRVESGSSKLVKTATLAGPSYRFALSLLELGDDRLPLSAADLVCRFEPFDGSPTVTCDGVRTIQIGRRMAAR